MSPSGVNDPIVHSEALVPGQRISLDTAHAERLRFREINLKEAFTLVDKDGRFFRASLIELSKNGGEALVYEAMALSPESPARITLFCAVLARQRMLFVIQKATELGVARVVPRAVGWPRSREMPRLARSGAEGLQAMPPSVRPRGPGHRVAVRCARRRELHHGEPSLLSRRRVRRARRSEPGSDDHGSRPRRRSRRRLE